LSPLALLGLIALLAIARLTLSIKPFAAGDVASPAVAVVRDYLDGLVAASLVALLLVTFVVRTYYIPSGSMLPTLKVGDVVLVDQLAYRLHAPREGDLAVFTPPVASGGDDFIKRVIGVPGDTIRISRGIVYRNGIPLREPYESAPPNYDLSIEHYGIVVDGTALNSMTADIPPKSMWQAPNRIPKGFFFMLGDNRNVSDDSHIWGFAQLHGRFAAGPLARGTAQASFIGRAFMILWPLRRIRILHA
jgi:signal peptidase I